MDTRTFAFTQARLAAIVPPVAGEVSYYDATVPGLVLRVRPSGSLSFSVRYQIGGRGSGFRRYVVGRYPTVTIDSARREARRVLDEAHRRLDPAGRRQQAAIEAREAAAIVEADTRRQLGRIVDDYAAELESQGVVAWKQIRSLLNRELSGPLGADTPVTGLTRDRIIARCREVRDDGRVGLAPVLRTRIHGLLAWCADAGLVPANVLAGARRRRGTRAERLAAAATHEGRALDMPEIAILWRALDHAEVSRAFAAYVRFLLVTGTRRTETATIQLGWVRARPDGLPLLTLPPEVTKNGRAHVVPLPALASDLLRAAPRPLGTDLAFPGRAGRLLTGWSKTWPKVTEAAAALGLRGKLRIHDLRKTARSHWTRLGVADDVAEALLNHVPRNTLLKTYDLYDRLQEKADALARWCAEIETAIAQHDARRTAEIVPVARGRRVA